ncbi:MAG: HAD-IIIC family phosphatase [Gemmatimonadaceae bacterium]
MPSRLLSNIRRSLARDRGLPLGARLAKGWRYVAALARARRALRSADRLGRRVRTVGRPIVRNDGRLVIGDDVVINSTFSPVELRAFAGGEVAIGSGVAINYGTLIAAASAVRLGDGVSLGPYCILADHEREPADGAETGAAPIDVGDGVWLAGRVTVLPGSRIGPGTVVAAGSVVSGELPGGVVAAGIPARVLRRIADAEPAATPGPEAATALPTPSAEPPTAVLGRGMKEQRGLVLADFTVGDLALRLADAAEGPVMRVVDAPYCQIPGTLLRDAPADAADFVLVWPRPEVSSPAFRRLQEGEAVGADELVADVRAFCELVRRSAGTFRLVLVATWTAAPWERGLGPLDLRPGGVAWALGLMNAALAQELAGDANVFVLDAQRWLAAAPRGAATERGWYLGKVPYHPEVFAEAARDVKAAARALAGQARKLLVLDLDDTLWGGIVGDVGWEALQLGGHDSVGEAFVDFQRAAKALTKRGVVLAVVSKNTEEVALEAMRSHPEMVIRPDDLVAWRINWQDKAQNIADIAAELNLGLQSVVFVDDNPRERARVRDALPEVFVPEWPEDKLLYRSALAALRCFDVAAISAEDRERTKLYAAERQRETLRTRVGSLDEWLLSLGIEALVEPLGPANLARTAQLLNKTNQMNLRTRRLSEVELAEWARGDGRAVLPITVSDKLGSAGLTGILSLEMVGDRCVVTDFVLSCRVMGRRIEESMAHLAVEWGRARGAREVVAAYVPTKKNRPCLDFWRASGFAVRAESPEGTEFVWDAAEPYPQPACVAVQWESEAHVEA